jgi:hypothetical protein
MRLICCFTDIFHGFAHGWMTSQVAQFGGVLLVALAAGGFGRRLLLVVAEPHG